MAGTRTTGLKWTTYLRARSLARTIIVYTIRRRCPTQSGTATLQTTVFLLLTKRTVVVTPPVGNIMLLCTAPPCLRLQACGSRTTTVLYDSQQLHVSTASVTWLNIPYSCITRSSKTYVPCLVFLCALGHVYACDGTWPNDD